MYIKIALKGKMAHFKKRAYNNNPLTHSVMPKTAFIGLIGAVCGIRREEMNVLYPSLCDGIKYSIKLINPLNIKSYAFTCRKAVDLQRSRTYFEYIINPHYHVIIEAISDVAEKTIYKFYSYVSKSQSVYPPYLGTADCFASIKFIEKEKCEHKTGAYITTGIVSYDDIKEFPDDQIIYTASIPIHETDFTHDRFMTVAFSHKYLKAEGDYIEVSGGECLCQI